MSKYVLDVIDDEGDSRPVGEYDTLWEAQNAAVPLIKNPLDNKNVWDEDGKARWVCKRNGFEYQIELAQNNKGF